MSQNLAWSMTWRMKERKLHRLARNKRNRKRKNKLSTRRRNKQRRSVLNWKRLNKRWSKWPIICQKYLKILYIVRNHIIKTLKYKGDTALHCAVVDNKPNTLKQLLRAGMPPNNQSDHDGATALCRAAETGNVICAKILIENKADINCINYMG